MNAASDLNPAELAALLHFYADAGVEWLVDDEPVDRIAQFEAQKAARAQAKAPASARERSPQDGASSASNGGSAPSRRPGAAAPPPATTAPVSVPAGQAVEAARSAANGAGSLAELKTAIETFHGCNLKNSARSTVFASGDPTSGIAIIGPMPNADDDRDGAPFSGRAGDLLDRMLAAIGLSREGVLMTNVIPWRPPGNRMPSAAEMDICQPFIERQIMLARPKALLLLGNFPARFFIGGNGTIHTMRGKWQTVSFAGMEIPALATFHPQELLAIPANKALTWQDLLAFQHGLQ
ncbi:uracil-DNA glycosylase [Rhizobium wenxiniae]|uniref:Type-4 uracil-DNA glycosylase n=1 Tax=Rhizobium wenxiniae TaxID=1737357 RepID=A0A7W9Y580_9HYPH|nr:uracil-DNA glycosylase [Rhizobium wenxiniae]MBB6162212.1 DNA polymerase [Rhizobium wenxiniae]GGG00320.1 uracil-DNA glycosylase [Rhizobium wenxiniae]